jgi:hypothetical protein
MKVWRLIIGALLIGVAARPPTNLPHDSTVVTWVIVFKVLIAGVGVWLAISFFRRPK